MATLPSPRRARLGRGVRGALFNSLDRSSNWQGKVTARGESRHKRVNKKGRTVGKKGQTVSNKGRKNHQNKICDESWKN